MSDRATEPRGLTLADLLILVAGIALSLGLPEINPRPSTKALWNPSSGQLTSAWLAYLVEMGEKLGLAFGLTALFRCARYRRPIRAPEFLALHLAWNWAQQLIATPGNGWLEFYSTTMTGPNSWTQSLDYKVYGLWHTRWFAVGCLAAVCLAISPIRRRLSPWLIAILQLLAFEAFTTHLASLSIVYRLPSTQRSVEFCLQLASAAYFLGARQLPMAASLVGLWRHGRSSWPIVTWLAFVLAMSIYLGNLARELTERFIMRNISYMPPLTREGQAFHQLVVPALILAGEVLVLAWLTRAKPQSRVEPTSAA